VTASGSGLLEQDEPERDNPMPKNNKHLKAVAELYKLPFLRMA
jgi:hypothetical protein